MFIILHNLLLNVYLYLYSQMYAVLVKLSPCYTFRQIRTNIVGLFWDYLTITFSISRYSERVIFIIWMYMHMLSGCELIDTENISLPSQNMKFVGVWAKQTSHKLHILSNRLIFFSINHIHIQMTYLSSLIQP